MKNKFQSRRYLSGSVSTKEIGSRETSGVGYVVLGTSLTSERESYVQNCLLKSCVTIAFENGGFLEGVPVLKHVWADIEFPEEITELGSCVLWQKIPKMNSVCIVGVLPKNNSIVNVNEHQFSLSRELNGKHVQILGDAKTGKIVLNVQGATDSAELMVYVGDKNLSSSLNVIVKGSASIDVSESISIVSKKHQASFDKDGFVIKNDTQSFSKIMNDFFTEIMNAVIQTPAGPGNIAPSSSQKINLIKERFNKLFKNGA